MFSLTTRQKCVLGTRCEQQGGDSLRIIFKEISSERASSQRQTVARRKKKKRIYN